MDPTYVGTVKSFNSEKGWGFIECSDTLEIFGKDIFLLRSQLNGDTCCKDDQVSFCVSQGSRGPEAARVRVMRDTGFGGAPGASGMHGTHSMAAVMAHAQHGGFPSPCLSPEVAYAMAMQAEIAAHSPPVAAIAGHSGAKYCGQVKNWNPVKGWGMISCPNTNAIYGKDMFFMKSAVLPGGEIEVGSQVSFAVQAGLKGPEGAFVQVLSGSPAAPPAFNAAHVWGALAGSAAIEQMALMQAGMMPQGGAAAGRSPFRGSVKSFNDEKGWGHIACDATHKLYGKDMFLLRNRVSGGKVKVGDEVGFAVVMGSKGPEASDVNVLAGAYGAYGAAAGASFGRARINPY